MKLKLSQSVAKSAELVESSNDIEKAYEQKARLKKPAQSRVRKRTRSVRAPPLDADEDDIDELTIPRARPNHDVQNPLICISTCFPFARPHSCGLDRSNDCRSLSHCLRSTSACATFRLPS